MNEVMHQRAECRWWLLCCLSFHSCPTGNPSAHPGCCPGPRNPSQATLRAHSAHQITFKILISRGSMELWIWPKADCLGEVRRAKKELNQFLPCGAVPGLALELPGVPWRGRKAPIYPAMEHPFPSSAAPISCLCSLEFCKCLGWAGAARKFWEFGFWTGWSQQGQLLEETQPHRAW